MKRFKTEPETGSESSEEASRSVDDPTVFVVCVLSVHRAESVLEVTSVEVKDFCVDSKVKVTKVTLSYSLLLNYSTLKEWSCVWRK